MNAPTSARAQTVEPAEASSAPAARARPTSVLIVGVGGQGVIMVSKVLAELCQRRGLQVKQSEVHGMAKRGGVVFSHVRFGREVWSPTIPMGEADVLVALEWAEAVRWLPYLAPEHGTFVADTQRIVPPFACRNRKRGAGLAYTRETPEEIVAKVASGYALDATDVAARLGNARAANTVLLGILSTALDFPPEAWEEVIAANVPPKTIEINRAAFREGRAWALAAPGGMVEAGALPAPPPIELPEARHWLEITPAWCKGCDICVKMCPERCLALENQVAVLTDPGACTGCRICEWLCPDFAITVHVEPAVAGAEG